MFRAYFPVRSVVWNIRSCQAEPGRLYPQCSSTGFYAALDKNVAYQIDSADTVANIQTDDDAYFAPMEQHFEFLS